MTTPSPATESKERFKASVDDDHGQEEMAGYGLTQQEALDRLAEASDLQPIIRKILAL